MNDMTDRERLIELLRDTFEYTRGVCISFDEAVEINADYLLANGDIVVPPCKVGDTVFELKASGKIVKGIATSIHQNLIGKEQGRWIVTFWFDDYYANSKEAGFECGTHLYSPFEDFGKTVFLTKEEAEAELQKRGVPNAKNN